MLFSSWPVAKLYRFCVQSHESCTPLIFNFGHDELTEWLGGHCSHAKISPLKLKITTPHTPIPLSSTEPLENLTSSYNGKSKLMVLSKLIFGM